MVDERVTESLFITVKICKLPPSLVLSWYACINRGGGEVCKYDHVRSLLYQTINNKSPFKRVIFNFKCVYVYLKTICLFVLF